MSFIFLDNRQHQRKVCVCRYMHTFFHMVKEEEGPPPPSPLLYFECLEVYQITVTKYQMSKSPKLIWSQAEFKTRINILMYIHSLEPKLVPKVSSSQSKIFITFNTKSITHTYTHTHTHTHTPTHTPTHTDRQTHTHTHSKKVQTSIHNSILYCHI